MSRFKENREFLKSKFIKNWDSDKKRGLPEPPRFKEYDDSDMIISLPSPNKNMLKKDSLDTLLKERRTFRDFTDYIMRIEELSYLLWATQGIVEEEKSRIYRPVPSGGSTNPFETYLAIKRVEGIQRGIYRYLPENHEILLIKAEEDIHKILNDSVVDQEFVLNASATFIWSVVPYRGEWKYEMEAHKLILIELGHVSQNLYLASDALGLGTAAIAGYKQGRIDSLIEVDGENEFAAYLGAVGMKEGNI